MLFRLRPRRHLLCAIRRRTNKSVRQRLRNAKQYGKLQRPCMDRQLLESYANASNQPNLRNGLRDANKNVLCHLLRRKLRQLEHKRVLLSYANTIDKPVVRQQRNANKNVLCDV